MLNKWLKCNERNPRPYSLFVVIDVEEFEKVSLDTSEHLLNLLTTSRFDPEYLKAITQRLGWQNFKKSIIAKQVPKQTKIKRGQFGEALINAILQEFYDYKIPVPKLYFRITSDQSLPATDTVALKIGEQGAITEVCFVESKLRRDAKNVQVALEGCSQLQADYQSKLPDILKFISERLHERQDPLFDAFLNYLGDRLDTTDRDTFSLSLCWEASAWSETVLENLQENNIELPRLTVHLIRINNLSQLIDDLFAKMGVNEISDDDD